MKYMKLASNGFSLMELMIGGAILAGIGLTGAQLIKGQKKVQSNIDHDLELDLMHAKISDMFTENAKDCDATFRSKYNTSNLSAITQIRKCVDGCDSSKDASSVNASTSQVIYTTGLSSPHLTPPPTGSPTRNMWYIQSFGNLQPQNGATSTNIVVMPIHYAHKTQSRVVTKYVTMAMRFSSTGKFLQCLDQRTSNIQNLEKEMCGAVKITTGATTLRGVWNGDTQKCVVSPVTCPAGTTFVGIPGSGVPGASSPWSCKPVTNIVQSKFIPGDSLTGTRDWLPHINTETNCIISTPYTSKVRIAKIEGNRVTVVCF